MMPMQGHRAQAVSQTGVPPTFGIAHERSARRLIRTMPTELRDAASLDANEAAEILIDERPPAEKVAIRDARRAMDHAVMAIFELAFSLESLTDAIGRFSAEAPSALRELMDAGYVVD